MPFNSDESTLFDAVSGSTAPEVIPPNDYLWFSPIGEAFPGWHHQLVLHMLAVDNTWNQGSPYDFSTIKRWLREQHPSFFIPNEVIGAIASQYLDLDVRMRTAYANYDPHPSLYKCSTRFDSNAASIFEFDLQNAAMVDGLFDSALFQQAEAEVTADYYRSKAATAFQSNLADVRKATATSIAKILAPEYSTDAYIGPNLVHIKANEHFTSKGSERSNSFTYDNHLTRKRKQSNDDSDSDHHLKDVISVPLCTNAIAKTPKSPSTPDQPIPSPKTPCAPRKLRTKSLSTNPRTMQPLQRGSFPSGPVHSKQVEDASNIDDVVITEQNAKIYAPLYLAALVEKHCSSREQAQDVRMVDAEGVLASDAHLVDHGNGYAEPRIVSPEKRVISLKSASSGSQRLANKTAAAAKIRPPNPEKYIETSRSHWKIPASEAIPFIAWWQPSDPIPDKVEGYFWYCDNCYVPKSNDSNSNAAKGAANDGPRGSVVSGRFSGKRSVEKHYQDVHKQKWKPILPEPERVTCRPDEELPISATDTHMEEQPFGTGNFQTDHNNDDQRFPNRYRTGEPGNSTTSNTSSLTSEAAHGFNSRLVSAQRRLFEQEVDKGKDFNTSTATCRDAGVSVKDAENRKDAIQKHVSRSMYPPGIHTENGRRLPDSRVNFASKEEVLVFDENLPPSDIKCETPREGEALECASLGGVEVQSSPNAPLKPHVNVAGTGYRVARRNRRKKHAAS